MSQVKTDYSREELIAICERALANLAPDRMDDRDCPSAFEDVAKFYAVLRFTKVPFRVLTAEARDRLETDARSIWVEYSFPDFEYFELRTEYDAPVPQPKETVYLPTLERLELAEARPHGTWY